MYAFALLDSGQVRPELTVWPSTAMSFGLFDEERGMREAAAEARATLNTDWGSRALAGESKLFDPLHYNNGTVWPFCTGFTAWGQYRYRNPVAGFAALSQIVNSGFTWGLGHNPEVMGGMMYEPLEAAVPQQFFGTSFILTVLGRGMLGWEPDIPAGTIRFSPQFPTDWDRLTVHGVPAGRRRYDVLMQKTPTELRVTVRRSGGPTDAPDTLIFVPHLPLGSRLTDVKVHGGVSLPSEAPRQTARDLELTLPVVLAEEVTFELHYEAGYEVFLPRVVPQRGDRSRAMRLLDQRLEGDTLVLTLEGREGTTDTLWVRHSEMPEQRAMAVSFDGVGDPVDGYVRMTLRVSP